MKVLPKEDTTIWQDISPRSREDVREQKPLISGTYMFLHGNGKRLSSSRYQRGHPDEIERMESIQHMCVRVSLPESSLGLEVRDLMGLK